MRWNRSWFTNVGGADGEDAEQMELHRILLARLHVSGNPHPHVSGNPTRIVAVTSTEAHLLWLLEVQCAGTLRFWCHAGAWSVAMC